MTTIYQLIVLIQLTFDQTSLVSDKTGKYKKRPTENQ